MAFKGFTGRVLSYMTTLREQDEIDALIEKHNWGYCRHCHKAYHVPTGSIEVTGKASGEKLIAVAQTTIDEFILVYEDGTHVEHMLWEQIDANFRVESVKRKVLFEAIQSPSADII